MESSSDKWICEQGIHDSTSFLEYPMNPLDYSKIDTNIEALQANNIERPPKPLNDNGWKSCTSTGHVTTTPSSQIISFRNTDSPQLAVSQQVYGLKNEYDEHIFAVDPKNEAEGSSRNVTLLPPLSNLQGLYKVPFRLPKHVQGMKKNMAPLLQAKVHIIAERKRRENIGLQLITLSSLVPGRKKADKVSVLDDVLNYVKHLQEHVKTLEEQAANNTTEPTVIVKKTNKLIECQSNQYHPEIEARVSDRDVLIRIHCEKDKGSLVNILTEIEKLPLTVVSSTVLPFGNSTLDITVVAKMDAELATTAKDLAENLRSALLQIM